YLPLIEQKINAFDQAAPLQGWDLPEAFTTLQRLMEGRMHKHGRREYVQVLRLLETFTLADLQAAVEQAIDLGAIGFDAVMTASKPMAPRSMACSTAAWRSARVNVSSRRSTCTYSRLPCLCIRPSINRCSVVNASGRSQPCKGAAWSNALIFCSISGR
ncbi:hypothetical protein OSJ57_27050, partial [Sphingomonas sp. HH69]